MTAMGFDQDQAVMLNEIAGAALAVLKACATEVRKPLLIKIVGIEVDIDAAHPLHLLRLHRDDAVLIL